MPELPEVETVVRQLAPHLANNRINQVRIIDQKLAGPEFSQLPGMRIDRVERLGKQVVLSMSDSRQRRAALAIHLRMSGRLIWQASLEKSINANGNYVHPVSVKQKHLRALIEFETGQLSFFDSRRFGTIRLGESSNEFLPQGVDPCTEDFTETRLRELLAGARQASKVWLLRQDRVVGLGNIYACEVLFDAGISPFCSVADLTPMQIRRMHKSIKQILQAAIDNCGTTFSDFQDSRGELGSYQQFLKVYLREGEPCLHCGEALQRVSQHGRSTYFCAHCQV